MTRHLLAALATIAGMHFPTAVAGSERAPRQDTIHVAAPTGERGADRTSILAALERARPGDVVQFGPGTYLVGELIPIETPQLTMLGHANGTTLRGCELDSYEQVERDRQAARDDLQARLLIMNRCGVFEMTGGHGTIRGLTFEHTWMGLALGWQGIEDRVTDGGYLVENNVFRNSGNAVRGGNLSSTPTVIRGNRFINVFRALSADGTFHVLDNDISRTDRIVLPQGVGAVIGISAAEDCVIEGNRIEGPPSGIFLYGSPGKASRRNVIRDNTITGTGFPLGLWADQEDAEAIQIEDNLIERNRITGGVIGIALNRASGNRILDNTISGITVRDPSLGEANGAGLWLSPGSDENEIFGNMFEDIATYLIVLEGDSNRVELRSASDTVRDLGSGNRISGPGGSAGAAAPPLYESKFVEVRGVRLHYLDFGGSGLPVVFVHDWYEDAHTWTSFAPLFADAYRVLALTRRGYGESDDVGWGYDVATQAEDILGFLDALGIERAVLVGRHPTTQDMTWIAEHHPQRLAGLVYLHHAVAPSPGEGRMLRDLTFAEMMMRYGGCWMGEEAYHRSAPRLLYRPHFVDDNELRIGVPAISFTHPRDFAAGAGDTEFLDLTLQMATGVDPGGGYCHPATIRMSVEYLTALANEPERLAEVRALVPTREERKGYAEAFERAFGPNLRIVRLEQAPNYRTDPGSYHPHIQIFLQEVARLEATRPNEAAADSLPPAAAESARIPVQDFIALAADEERVAAIRQVLTEGDLSLPVHRAMGRAFGTNLRP
jgi:parallel beta-helix repeat protein